MRRIPSRNIPNSLLASMYARPMTVPHRGCRLNSARHPETRGCFDLFPVHVSLIDPSINTTSVVLITYAFSKVPPNDATFCANCNILAGDQLGMSPLNIISSPHGVVPPASTAQLHTLTGMDLFVSAYVLRWLRSRSPLHCRSYFFRPSTTCRCPTFITISGLIRPLKILKTLRCGCILRFSLLTSNRSSLSTGTLSVEWTVTQLIHRFLHLPSDSALALITTPMLPKLNTDHISATIFPFRLLSRRLSGFIGTTAQRSAMSTRTRAGMVSFHPANEIGYGPLLHTTGQRPSSEVELKCYSNVLGR